MKLVLATRNKGKVAEIKKILEDLPEVELLSLRDFPDLAPIEETGKTFQENAILKAKTVANSTGCWALADDSGLVVEALNGAPGVYSARYAGKNATDTSNNQKLLKALEKVPWEKRRAAFVCVMALCSPKGKCYTCEGRFEGIISFEPKGNAGFGYDPVFYVPEYDKTVAELTPEIKNMISHRAQALKKIKPLLIQIIRSSESNPLE